MTRRVAVVGLGMGALPHLKSLVDLKGRIEVAGAYSRSEERRRACAERFGLPVTDDLDGLIADPSISASVIATAQAKGIPVVQADNELEAAIDRSTELRAKIAKIQAELDRFGDRFGRKR